MQGVVEDDVRFCAASGGAISLLRRVCPSETLPMNAVSLSSLHFDFASYFWNQRCVHDVFLVRKVFSQFCSLVLPCLGLFCALFVFTVEAFNTKDEKRQRMK